MGFIKYLKQIFFSGLINTICLSLILNSPGMALFFTPSSYAQDDQFAKQKEKCEEDKSKKWDSKKNRCITTKDVYEDRQAFRECEKIKGPQEDDDGNEISEEAAKRKCFDDNAANMIGDLTASNSSLKAMQTAAEAIGYIQMFLELIAKDGAKADCNSSKVMAAAGIVGLGVDIYLTFFVDDELHKLQDKYAKEATKKKQVDKGGYEAQIEAFNYLHKEQETLISIDEKKIIAYGIMTGLNGLAMVLAIYEMTPFGAAGACKATTGGGEDVDVPDKPKDAPDADTPDTPDKPKGDTPDAPDKPKGDPGGGGDTPPKSSKFKEAATDVKTKKSGVDGFAGFKKDVPDAPKKPKEGGFRLFPGDKKGGGNLDVVGGWLGGGKPKAPDIDVPTMPKDPGLPPKGIGDPPGPPTKPNVLKDPPGDVPPAPKRPGDPPNPPDPPGKRPTNPGDPGEFAPPKPGDTPPKNPGDKGPTNPGDPPTGPGKRPQGPGDPPKPPDKPEVLKTPPPDIDVPPPKKPKGDPPEMPDRPKEFNQKRPPDPGDTPPPKPSGKKPKDPGKPPGDPGPPVTKPRDVDPPGKAPDGYDGVRIGDVGDPPKKPKKPREPTMPEKPANMKDGDWIQANIDATGAKKKNVANMTDTDIDNLDLTRKQKQDVKDLRAKKQKDLDNIKTQKRKYGPDADVKNLERDIVKYDKQSFDLQNKSQLNEVGKQRKIKAGYDQDMAVYNRKKTKFDTDAKKYDLDMDNYNYQKNKYDSTMKNKADFENYGKKKADFDNYKTKKAEFDSYSSKKTEFDSYQSKKADVDSFNQQKADFDGYKQQKADVDNYNAGKKKYDSDVDQFNNDYKKYDADLNSYNQKQKKYDADYDTWQSNQNVAKTKNADYKAANQKYDADMDLYNKDNAQFMKDKKGFELDRTNYNQKQKKFDADMGDYNQKKQDFDNYNNQKADFDNHQKQQADFDDYNTKKKSSDDYNADMDSWTKDKKKYELDNTNYKQKQKKYDADMDQYNKDMDTWSSNKKVSESKNTDFQAAQKKYDADMDQYNKDMDTWTTQKKKAELDRANYSKKRDQFDADMEDYNKKNLDNDYKQNKYDKDVAEWEANQKKPEAPEKPTEPEKPSFKDAAEDVKTKKKVLDDIEGYKKPDADAPDAPDKPKDVGDADAPDKPKDVDDADAPDKPKDADDADAPDKPKDDADADADADKKKDRWTWEEYWKGDKPFFEGVDGTTPGGWKEGAGRVWKGIKNIVLPGARVGTRVTNTVKRYSKDGKKVDYCDKEAEEGCRETVEEKTYELDGEPVDKCDPKKEEGCRVIFVPQDPESYNPKKKELDFSDPNKLLESFFNTKFEKRGLTNIEDALMLDKEWKAVVKGEVKSPSLSEYENMQKSGMFGKNPEMANLLYNVLVISRTFSKKLYDAAFPVVQAQTTPGTTPPPAIDTTSPNTWDEETDDEEDADNRKKRQQEKGKAAGMMLGMAGGAMIGGLIFEKVLDRMGPLVQKVRTFFGTSPGIAILSGMSTLINGLTLGFVVKEKKAFQENLKKIDDIKAKFESDMADFCPKKDDRGNQSKPNCYCYSMGGKRNPLRKNSQICQGYWARFDGSFYVGAGKYKFEGEKNIKGCVDQKGNYDVKCNCRKYKNRTTGQNACFKTKTSFDGLGRIGNSTSTGVVTGYGNAVAQDPSTLHRLDGDAISRSAVKLKGAGDKALKAFNLSRAKAGKKPLEVGPKQLEKFVNKVMAMPGSRGAMRDLAAAKSPPARPPMKVAKDIGLKETKKKTDIKYEPIKKKAVKKEAAKKKAPEWDFDMGEEEKAQDSLEFMDKKYDYKKGVKRKEIVNKKGTSIFKVISNRYINTGLKLLFEDD